MFLSQVHNWQDDAAVKQILVFIDQNRMNQFDVAYSAKCAVEGVDASDTTMGAIVKLRAVKNGPGEWIPVVRCGFVGIMLYEGAPVNSYESALLVAYNQFMSQMIDVKNFNPVIANLINSI